MPPITAALLPPTLTSPPPAYSPTAPVDVIGNPHPTAQTPNGPSQPQVPMQLDIGGPTQSPTCPVIQPVIATIPPPSANPSNGCVPINGQAGVAATPVNGYATLTGNGNIRVPPDGMEDVPQSSDVPPV